MMRRPPLCALALMIATQAVPAQGLDGPAHFALLRDARTAYDQQRFAEASALEAPESVRRRDSPPPVSCEIPPMPRFQSLIITTIQLAFACARSDQMPPTSAQGTRKLIDAWYTAWTLHEPERIDTIFTDDAVYEDVAGGGVRRGKGEIKQMLHAAVAFAPDFRASLKSLTVSGDTATTEWEIEGTQTGPTSVGSIGELPPTGRTFRIRGASVLLVRGGRIARVTDYYDQATFWRQLGGTFAAPKR